MKKILILIAIASVISLSVSGCSKSGKKSEHPTKVNSSEHPEHPSKGSAKNEHPDHPSHDKSSNEHPDNHDHSSHGKSSGDHSEHPSKGSGKSEHPEHPSNEHPTGGK
ncbi:MAG: hypothetical protein HOB40_08180 [Candidatus Marinimicrobia bacterium]|jgi:hypothetical protein|nr:hypothetical protein [Candidatus Neomarinimicrobiota bacterium]MBT3502643.1 hypothetical protein [Candidatus Neomarinimicrobiota bacterium]MBT3839939.1 hypothetical protein [Candidatus Neomarinimicrobiota bacterium]MBT4000186.1 hypothetical protein [Candidatus Neomarinimicrobiota bacterium]MBT4281736.1 hypothetical protein [Candidatus Neomarinimicrobiota bacterium]